MCTSFPNTGLPARPIWKRYTLRPRLHDPWARGRQRRNPTLPRGQWWEERRHCLHQPRPQGKKQGELWRVLTGLFLGWNSCICQHPNSGRNDPGGEKKSWSDIRQHCKFQIMLIRQHCKRKCWSDNIAKSNQTRWDGRGLSITCQRKSVLEMMAENNWYPCKYVPVLIGAWNKCFGCS